MKTILRAFRGAAVAALALGGAGCAQLGTVGDILGGTLGGMGGGTGNEVYGEVRYVDTQRQILQVTTQQGQTANVYFDSRTRVVYQNQQYNVTALERGDEVGMRVQQDTRGNAYTDYIQVTRSVQERTGTVGGVGGQQGSRQLDGRVGWIDYNRGQFELQSQYGRVTVVLPYNPSSTTSDRFRRLRQGDYTRVEGRLVTQDRFELDRFY